MAKKEVRQMDDEIYLFELIEFLWKEKVLIVVITAVITLIGLGYAIVTPSTYEARVELLPPAISDIAELQKFDVLKSSQTQSSTQIFKDFLSILRSNQLHKKFLLEEGAMQSLFEKETTPQMALAKLDKMIQVEVPKKVSKNDASFKLQFNDAELAAKFANRLVELGIEQYQMNISLAFNSEKDQRIKQLNDEKSSLIDTHERRLDQEITKLKEAFLIAKKLDIIEPRESKDQIIKTESRSSVITEEMRYLYSQGTRALNAEIETVTQRKKNLSMVNGLIAIEQDLSLLNTLSFDASKVMPITIDLVVIGGFLAIIFALIRNAVRNRKSHS
jgi:chain length determinant protein (polysaccharide antigen chain regulator)